jgi:hypothetical protein
MTHDDDPTGPRNSTACGASDRPEKHCETGEPDAQPLYHVVHVERAFSAQPTLGDALGPAAVVHELPLAEALAGQLRPDVIWASDATLDLVHLLHEHFPEANILATLPRKASTRAVLDLLTEGADLVLRDEGILLAAAALHAMARRRRPSGSPTGPPGRRRPHPGLPDPRDVDRTLTPTGI